MDRTDENVRDYVASVCRLCRHENLKALDSGASAKIIEHSCRLAEDQEKLSTHFAEIADVIREASFWADRDGSTNVQATHLQKAVEEKIYRSNLIQEKIQEMIQRGTLLIGTQGAAVGQVNGLAVIDLGNYAFGRPNRITASIGLGRGGIVDINGAAMTITNDGACFEVTGDVGCATCPGDLTGDGFITGPDVQALIPAFGSVLGDANYEPCGDLTGDNAITGPDVQALIPLFGGECP